MKRLLSCVLLVVLVSPAHAFEPQKHEDFSREAAMVYQACTGRALPGNVIDAFAEGSVNEDDLMLERALNWHFYNRDGRIGTYRKFFLTCEGSNERIFRKRLDALDHLIAAQRPLAEIYATAGRAVHHIQDMSSPPHVMPIYHTIYDKYDKYEFVPKAVDVSGICAKVNAERYHPGNLLKKAAQETLNAVQAPVVFEGGKTFYGETWLNFWGGPDDKQLAGFKTYGDYGNKFGRVPPCKTSKICDAYSESVYKRFYDECRARAVTDTVRFLLFLDSRVAK